MLDAALIAVALAMDATAVVAARSVSGAARRELFTLAGLCALFQAGMAGAGLALGTTAAGWIASWDHWLAFGLLTAIGGKMLVDASRGGEAPAPRAARLGARAMLLLALATSVDALAAGVTLPALRAPAALALLLIGLASFVLPLLGGIAGSALGERVGTKLEVAGGLVLIAIGIRTLVEHL